MAKQKNEKDIILAVGAHPDDIDFAAGGTIAKWTREGAKVYYLILTDGSKGSDDLKMTSKKLSEIRKKEQLAAAKILNVKKVFFLNYSDTELVPDMKLKEKITRKIRELKPSKVVTMNPQMIFSQNRSFVNHTDHRAAGLATLDSVYPLARDRLTFPKHEKAGLKPHKVKDLYLAAFGEGNYVSDIRDTIDQKILAIKAHKSQIDEKSLQRFKKWSKESGKNFKVNYAEVFVRLEFS